MSDKILKNYELKDSESSVSLGTAETEDNTQTSKGYCFIFTRGY